MATWRCSVDVTIYGFLFIIVELNLLKHSVCDDVIFSYQLNVYTIFTSINCENKPNQRSIFDVNYFQRKT